MDKKIKIILLLFMTTLANSILFAATVPIKGPVVDYPLELYAIWNPNSTPLFILSTLTDSIDYEQDLIQYSTDDYDLSFTNHTENFSLYVNSNFRFGVKFYILNIYFSDNFVPVSDIEYNNNDYPIIPLSINTTLNSDSFYYYGINNYISLYSITNSNIIYGSRLLDAKMYSYDILIPSGYNALELLYFNFYWTGYSQAVDQYWDLEAYARVEIVSVY